MKRYQKLVMILETERQDLEWKEVLKKCRNSLESLKVSMKEGYLDIVDGSDHIYEVFEKEEDVGIRTGKKKEQIH